MAVNAKRQKELKGLGFLLQNDKEHFAVRFLSRAGNFTVEELRNIAHLAEKYGRGYVGETTRLQVEIPWIKDADVEAVKAQIKENANPAKWVCVEAEEVVVENIDNTVLFLMANESEATPIKEAFMNLAQSK